MYARIPPQNAISKSTSAAINAEVKRRVDIEFSKRERDYCRRIMKLFCAHLNKKKYGNFGAKRLFELIQDISHDIENDNELLWTHTDQILKKIGLEFPDDFDE